MTRFQNPYIIAKDKIQTLIEEYQFQEYEGIIHKVLNSSLGIFNVTEKIYPKYFEGIRLEMVELIIFLRKCLGDKIQLTGTVKNPSYGEIKETPTEYTLKSQRIIFEFEKWANALLEQDQDGFYNSEFGWKPKELDENSHFFFPEPYSDEELEKIVNYEKVQQSKSLNHTQNSRNGRLAYSVYSNLNKLNVFKSKQQEGNAGITREYSFIFDLICIIGEHSPKEEIDKISKKEKFDAVKGWITAYKNKLEKKGI